MSKTIRKIKFFYVPYVKILRKSLRKKTRTCECSFNLVTRAFSLLTRGFELVTHGFEFVTRRFELVTRRFELATHISELVTRVLLFHTKRVSVNVLNCLS